MRFFGKRGELTSRQIVIIILAILGFFIAAVLLFSIYGTKNLTTQELCHLSLVERASAPIANQVIPLQCTTEKICITSEKNGKCKEFAGETGVRNVVIDISKDIAKQNEARRKIEMESANAFYDCWKITGGGKLDIFTRNDGKNILDGAVDAGFKEGIGWDNTLIRPKCIVCSRIAVAEDIYSTKEGNDTLESIDVNRYMATETVPGSSLTYFNVFSGGENTGGYAEFAVEEKVNGKRNFTGVQQIAIIFMQIKVLGINPNEAYWTNFRGNLLVGGGVMLTPAGSVVRKTANIFPWPISWLAIAAGTASVSYNYASETEKTVETNQFVAAGACGKFQTNLEGDVGCSLTKAVKWDVATIRQLCSGGIEGNL